MVETHVRKHSCKGVFRKSIGAYSLVTNYDFHPGGRLWVLWNPTAMHLRVLDGGAQFLHCSLLHRSSHRSFLVTFVYTYNRAPERLDLWDKLWGFSVDHPYTRGVFTWHNKQEAAPKWAKLDRLLVNQSWFLQMPTTTVTFLPFGISDHAPVILTTALSVNCHRPFRYLDCWVLLSDFVGCVSSGWLSSSFGGSIYALFAKLRRLRAVLKSIHCTEFSDLRNRVAMVKLRLNDCQLRLQASPTSQLFLVEEKQLLGYYARLKTAEMRVLAQRAKVQHLKLSDGNTKYFYASITARKFRNTIGPIEDARGQLCTGHEAVSRAFLCYYQTLLGSSEPVTSLPGDLFLENVLCQPAHLDVMVTLPEIKAALWSIDRNKSLGVNGYSSGFF
ncbi:hypothetical protein RND81_02G221000 [Saponaria officinalis]|uniref:Endonuclease/exonuclease/phosphatase domain-containing protein n=1 Tax=Saponaria officinalis TaxID=3572 RepID=A0AAW1MWC6_SAPOF